MRIVHYFDYKSPYAWLAQEAAFGLAASCGAPIEWLPYTLDIPQFLGRAEVDADGRVLVNERNDHQWRRVRYAYMDCRREANRRGLVLRGPQKVFDSSIAHVGFLWARRRGDFRPFHDRVFERFWRRELDIESPSAVAAVLEEAGIDTAGFPAFLEDDGRRELERIAAEAEAAGVFGVPSWLVGNDLFWGSERIDRVRERIAEAAG